MWITDNEMKNWKIISRLLAAVMVSFLSCGISAGQEKISDGLEIDKRVHNFGDIMLGSGPVSCTFNIKNTGEKPAIIYNVSTTCGCTDVTWTKEPIRPGKTGTISVTYSNDEGPYPFDKSVTVYLSDIKKPVILKLRGVSLNKKKPLNELYPISYGSFCLRESVMKCGNLDQGGTKSESVMVANTSKSPISVSFKDVSENVTFNISPNPIPAQSTAEMTFTVNADRDLWGKNYYWATPVINGKSYKNKEGDNRICVWAFTRENFSNISDSERMNGPRPMFKESTYTFGKIKKGTKVRAEFTFKNEGKQTLKIYKADSDATKWSCEDIPDVAAGKTTSFAVDLDTSDMPLGEALVIVTLTTNSPLRPIVNLFITGWIE